MSYSKEYVFLLYWRNLHFVLLFMLYIPKIPIFNFSFKNTYLYVYILFVKYVLYIYDVNFYIWFIFTVQSYTSGLHFEMYTNFIYNFYSWSVIYTQTIYV